MVFSDPKRYQRLFFKVLFSFVNVFFWFDFRYSLERGSERFRGAFGCFLGVPSRGKSGHFAKDILQKQSFAHEHIFFAAIIKVRRVLARAGTPLGPPWDPLGSQVGALGDQNGVNTRLTFMILSKINQLGYFFTCSHSRTKSPLLARMVISFETSSKNQLFTRSAPRAPPRRFLDASMTAWTPPRRLQVAPRPILVDF